MTSTPGAEHPIIDKYLKWMQRQFKPFMHVREAGEFGAGFSVVITGWPKETPKNVRKGNVKKFGVVMTKGERTKTEVSPKGSRSRRFPRGFDWPKGTPKPKGLESFELCPDPNRNEGTRGHVVGFAVKVTGRDESPGGNEVQVHRREVLCRSLVGLADYTHAMHVSFDVMP